MKPDLTEIKNAAYSRWPEIHAALGIPAKLLNTRKHQPCPHCGGKDRFRYTDHKHGGGYICNRCAPEGGSGFDLLMLVFGYSFTESVNQVSALLGHYPALLAAIEREGELQGLHITYLQADYPKPCGEDGLHAPEWRKLAASHPDTGETLPAKKMKARYAGALNGAAVHLGTPDGQGRLLAAEGIETALAASAMFDLPAAAGLSAHGLSAFDWPPETRELYIAADHDPSRTGIKAAEALARRAHAAGLTAKIWQPDKAGTDALDEWNTRKGRLKSEGAAQ